jgi:hypothetical protein
MPRTYEQHGIRFLYPDNWLVTDEQSLEPPYSVGLQTPQGGMWVLQIHEQGEPLELASEALKTMRAEYAELEADSITERIEEHDVIGFEMRFYYLDFVVMARVLSLRVGERTLVLLCQAEDRDYESLAPVFQAMLVSILRSGKTSPSLRATDF